MNINTVIITGATGFIGKALAIKLLKQGKKVYAIDINSERLDELKRYGNVVPIVATFQDYDKLSQVINETIDIVYHFAWQGVSGKDYSDVDIQNKNIEMAIKTVQIAIELKCKKIVMIGSSHQYLKGVNSIDGELNNPSIYGAAKMASKIICQTLAHNKIEFNNILFTNVFGVGDFSNRSTNIFLKKMINNEDLELIDGENLHDWTYIDDAINGLIIVGEKGKNNKEYYIGSRKLKKFKSILEEVSETLNTNSKLLFGKYTEETFVDYSKINLDELYNDTGFECSTNFNESILNTVKWLNEIAN